jgi:hypothetical protein
MMEQNSRGEHGFCGLKGCLNGIISGERKGKFAGIGEGFEDLSYAREETVVKMSMPRKSCKAKRSVGVWKDRTS